MLIKIEDLPNGQKIKHIKVDILFEDNQIVSSDVVSENHSTPNVFPEPPQEPSTPPARLLGDESILEIPPEMKDVEF